MIQTEFLTTGSLFPPELIYEFQSERSNYEVLAALNSNYSAATIEEFGDQIAAYIYQDHQPSLPLVDASVMQKVAFEFHNKAGTLTPQVEEAIDSIDSPAPRLRIAHQTDTFMYKRKKLTNLFFTLAYASSYLSRQHHIDPVQLYISIDYDDCSDTNFRRPLIEDNTVLDPNGEDVTGYFELKPAVAKSNFGRVMYAVDKPPNSYLEECIEELHKSAQRQYSRLSPSYVHKWKGRDFIEEEFQHEKEMLEQAWEKSDTLVEFNMMMLSMHINLEHDLPTVFIPGHASLPSLQKAHEILLNQRPTINQALDQSLQLLHRYNIDASHNSYKFPFWLICPTENCSRRLELEEQQAENNHIIVQTECRKGCKTKYEFDLGTNEHPDLSAVRGHITPRVDFDNRHEEALGIAGGVDYVSSSAHMIPSNMSSPHYRPPHFFLPRAYEEGRYI